MSQVDSQEISFSKYPFYEKIKKQVLNLNFETSSDWSDEARFLDEVREVGLKDEGRLTYHEMLLAYRRSQGIRRSQAKSIQSSDEDLSIEPYNIDYLPSQKHSKKRRPNSNGHRSHHSHHNSSPPAAAAEQNEDAFKDIYVRLADDRSKSSRRKRRSARRPVYDQSVYGPFRRVPNYQSFPNYPRYRSNIPPPVTPRPSTHVYIILAFILFVLMMVSLIPIFFS